MAVMNFQMHICDVCRLLDKDESLKECYYCDVCQAWICRDDKAKWGRRILAFGRAKSGCDCKGTN